MWPFKRKSKTVKKEFKPSKVSFREILVDIGFVEICYTMEDGKEFYQQVYGNCPFQHIDHGQDMESDGSFVQVREPYVGTVQVENALAIARSMIHHLSINETTICNTVNAPDANTSRSRCIIGKVKEASIICDEDEECNLTPYVYTIKFNEAYLEYT